MAAIKKPKRTFSVSHKIPMSAFKKLEKASENPPKAGKALRDFIAQGERLLNNS
jgi:hypothetical protein